MNRLTAENLGKILLAATLLTTSDVGFSGQDAVPTLVINSSNHSPVTTAKQYGVLDPVYREVARRAGIRIMIQSMSTAERSLINQNSGVDDGDVSRIDDLGTIHPNLIKVPEPVMHYEMLAFSRKGDFKSGPNSLAPYEVGIPNGWKILERMTLGAHSVTRLETGEQLFVMLDKDRINVAFIEKFQGLYFVKELGLGNIRILQPSMVEGDWFMYLNKKHQAWVPKLTAALRSMQVDGTYQKIPIKL